METLHKTTKSKLKTAVYLSPNRSFQLNYIRTYLPVLYNVDAQSNSAIIDYLIDQCYKSIVDLINSNKEEIADEQ